MNVDRASEAATLEARTPFYALDIAGMVNACRIMTAAWSSQFPRFELAYSYKTNFLADVTRALRSAGAGAEVVSGAELELAVDDGHEPRKVYFDGPTKSEAELRRALALEVRIQADSLSEVETIIRLSRETSTRPRVSLRLAGLRDGAQSSRFGLTTAEYRDATRLLASDAIPVTGIHFNTGLHPSDAGPYIKHIREYAELIREGVAGDRDAAERFVVDIGGGFPARSCMRNGAPVPHPLDFAAAVGETFDRLGIDREAVKLVIEPGRSLVEDFGYLVASVVAVKSRAGRRFAVLDAGTNLTRSISIWPHPVRFARHGTTRYDVYGAMCFENDLFGRDIPGPRDLAEGDRIVVSAAGGYDIPSANVWLRPHPPVYDLGKDGAQDPIRKPAEGIRT